MRAGIIFLTMTSNNFSHCWRWDTHPFLSIHLSILNSVSAHVVLSIPEMSSHFQKVFCTSMLPFDFVLILIAEDKLESSLQKNSGSKDE